MSKFRAPSPRYLGPAFHTTRGNNKPITRIVLHSTVSPCKVGQAEAVARYFRSSRSGGSAHYVVDPGGVVQVVFDSVIAQHAPPNKGSIGVEMCDMPSQDVKRWDDANHKALFARTARLVAELCLAYDVKPRFARAWRLKLPGLTCVTTHAEVSKAWHQSTHWDPGAWPLKPFMIEVRRQVKLIKAGK